MEDDNEAFLAAHDGLFRCTTLRAAEAWVATEWQSCTIAGREAVLKALFQWPSRMSMATRSRSRDDVVGKRGGGPDAGDVRILRLLAYADTYHDFREDAVVPGWLEVPKEVPLGVVQNENAFIRAMTSHASLTFGEEAVPNPLFGKDFVRAGFDVKGGAISGESLEDMYAKEWRGVVGKLGSRAAIVPVDIWSAMGSDQNRERLEMRLLQVARVIGVMRRLFGTVVRAVVDNAGDPLVSLVISLKYVSKALLKHVLVPDTHQNLEGISKRVRELLAAERLADEGDWDIIQTDASLFDASHNSAQFTFDTKPTGEVYRRDMAGYRVRLNGVVVSPGGRKILVEVEDTDGRVVSMDLTNKQATKHLSVSALGLLARIRVERAKDPIDQVLVGLSQDALFALKRAGDWGQVESCVPGNRVFFTRDKLAALYAAYRGVRFVYLRASDYGPGAGTVDGFPFMVQHTFTMCWGFGGRS